MELTDETRTYYKAVQPNGTDFRTGTVQYAVGATVTHPDPHDYDASGYLSVSVSATDCIGMEWPCRLLEVEPVDPWAPSRTLLNKRACHELRVVRELDPHLALGPQGVHVAALIERARTLSTDEAEQLDAAWYSAWDDMRDAAWDAAWYAGRDVAWDAAMRAAGSATRNVAWDAARRAAMYIGREATWDTAWAAAREAALALVVRDLISQEHYRTLTKPWASAIGPAHPDDHLEDPRWN